MRALPSPLLVVTDRHGCRVPLGIAPSAAFTLEAKAGRRFAEGPELIRRSPLLWGEGQGEGRGLSGQRTPLTPTLSPWERERVAATRATQAASFAPDRPSDREEPDIARFLLVVRAILEGGARWVWFRERDMDRESRRALACDLQRVVRAFGGILTVGEDPTLAAAIGADGVQLFGTATIDEVRRARDILPEPVLIGVSAHSLGDVEMAALAGADYVTLSPIFATASKPGYGPALGPKVFERAAGFGIPVIGLGGITPANAPACRTAGAAGVAVMGGLMLAPDPAQAAGTLLRAWG